MSTTWGIQMFFGAVNDVEVVEYLFLAKLKEMKGAFQHNKLYPHLTEAMKVLQAIKKCLNEESELNKQILSHKSLLGYGDDEVPSKLTLGPMFDVMEWASEHLEDIVREGRTILQFVRSNVRMSVVGVEPSYPFEGYLFVPDYLEGTMVTFRYEVSVSTNGAMYKISYVPCQDSLPLYAFSPREEKDKLIYSNPSIPFPGTYLFDTSIEFPFESTVLPVAKYILKRYIKSIVP